MQGMVKSHKFWTVLQQFEIGWGKSLKYGAFFASGQLVLADISGNLNSEQWDKVQNKPSTKQVKFRQTW